MSNSIIQKPVEIPDDFRGDNTSGIITLMQFWGQISIIEARMFFCVIILTHYFRMKNTTLRWWRDEEVVPTQLALGSNGPLAVMLKEQRSSTSNFGRVAAWQVTFRMSLVRQSLINGRSLGMFPFDVRSGEQGSSVGIVSGYRLDDRGIGFWFPAGE
jgi:hypothetical protein